MSTVSSQWPVALLLPLCAGLASAQDVAGAASATRASPQASRVAPSCAGTDYATPSGLVVDITPQKDRSLDLRSLTNPCISGVALQIHWSDIEPAQRAPDWSKLDQLFAAAESNKKWVHLEIFPGFFSPAWALEGVPSEQFPIQYGPGRGTVMTLPMPWDKVYLDRWLAFVKQLSDKYGKSPAFRMASVAGPTSVSVEMTLPNQVPELKTWQQRGFTARKFINAYQRVFQAYEADFPTQYISLTVGNALNIDDQGKIDQGEGMRTRQAIIDFGMHLLGHRFVLQNSDLHAGPINQSPATPFVMSYSGRVITGLEMRCAATLGTCSGALGAEGDPPSALRQSIDKGMAPNSAGHRIDYLEIHEADAMAAEMQPVLQYGASLFATKR